MNSKLSHMLALLLCFGIAPVCSAELDETPNITVTGEGRVFARPDMAQLQIGVTTEAQAAQEALRKNSQAMAALLTTLQAQGVPDKDILTSNFNLNPRYKYDDGGRGGSPVLAGYTASNIVQTKVRDLGKLGQILDSVVASGANNVNSITFSQANPEPLLDQARRNAINDAQHKAQIYAAAAGIKTGNVIQISETGAQLVPPRPLMMSTRAEAQGVPISAGEQELTTSVNVTFAIDAAGGK